MDNDLWIKREMIKGYQNDLEHAHRFPFERAQDIAFYERQIDRLDSEVFDLVLMAVGQKLAELEVMKPRSKEERVQKEAQEGVWNLARVDLLTHRHTVRASWSMALRLDALAKRESRLNLKDQARLAAYREVYKLMTGKAR